MSSKKQILSFEDVSFSYEGSSTKALDNVNLNIHEGEFVCILGGNGSGKTTLSKMTNALLVPSSGKVLICGLDTSESANLFSIRQYAGMVFQNPDDQMVGNFIEDDVAFGPENLCLPTEDIRQRVDASLKQVGLDSFAKHETRALSGGQKQRVAIASALAMRPRILVLDEAGSMLDPRGRIDLLKACKRLNENGLTILFVTHFLEDAAAADRVIVMKNGRIAEEGVPKEVLENQRLLREFHLDTPFAVRMCDALMHEGVPVQMHLDSDALVKDLHMLGFSPKGSKWEISGMDEDGSQESESGIRTQTKDRNTTSYAKACPDLPIINLIDVGYSYLDKSSMKRALKNQEKARAKKNRIAGRNQDGEIGEEARWGSDPSSIWALQNLTFSIFDGDFLGVIGHTGSGKSTLLKIVSGLVDPTCGKAMINGIDLSSKEGKRLVGETVGLVMQYPEKQLFAQTVYEDCAFGPRNMGLPEPEVRERVISALRAAGIEDEGILEVNPFRLSGGQQRRVAIAGILSMRPSILILDEPTAGLDPLGRKSLLKMIKAMNDNHGITIIMVSHNMDSISYLCNRILVLDKGGKYSSGTPIEVFSDEKGLKDIGLGVPSVIHLSNELGIDLPNYVPNMEQLSYLIAGSISSHLDHRREGPIMPIADGRTT